MSYGFEIDRGGGSVMLMRTHDGKGALETIHGINGQNITELNGDEVQAILDAQRDTRGKIEFLLSSGKTLTFFPDSASNDWNRRRVTEKA